MFTVDRLNRLYAHYGFEPVANGALFLKRKLRRDNTYTYETHTPAHDAIDLLDSIAEINTRGHNVGARLSIHDKHISAGVSLKPPRLKGKLSIRC